MDISETESDDCDWNPTDEEGEESGKLRVRKRKPKIRRSCKENNQSKFNNSEDFKENSRDRLVDAYRETTTSDICCSCSRTSSCKTTKCKCKAMGGSCRSSCGCLANKCGNRTSISNESQEPTKSGSVQRSGNNLSTEETDEDRLLVTQGAELLQGALVDRFAETNSDQGQRKPLSDIGNTQVCVNHTLKLQDIS